MPNQPDERSLADETPETAGDTAVPIVSSTVPTTPEGFDFEAWLAGVRPTRRSVKLYPHAHLIARLEELADRIDGTPADQDATALVDEFDQVKEQFQTGVWFTLEKRSSEWQTRYRKEIAKRLNLNLDGKHPHDTTIAALHQLAEQIVEPQGVTVRHLQAMVEANEGEANKLLLCMTNVNGVLAEKAGVLTRDFSDRRSGTTAGS